MDSSTPQSPANSYQCVDHQGYQQAWGPYGKWLSPAPYHTWGPNGKGWQMDKGKGKGYQADHGKGKGHGAKGGDGKVNNGNGKAADLGNGKGSPAEKPVNAWELKKQKRAAAAANKGTSQPNGDSVEVVEDENAEAQDILDRMNVVQGMINSLSDRTDKYSTGLKSNFLLELSRLRILKTQLKPLGDQVVVLETLVAKRKDNVQNIQEELDKVFKAQDLINIKLLKAQEDLVQAQDSLASVQLAKVEADAAKDAPASSPFLDQAKSMSDLLPKEKQEAFTECLKLLHQIMAPDVAMESKNAPTPAPAAGAGGNIGKGTSVSASGGSGDGVTTVAIGGSVNVAPSEQAPVVVMANGQTVEVWQSGGNGEVATTVACAAAVSVATDPYSVDLGTPHRARPLRRSASADSIDGRSDRSRTTSGSRTRMRYKQSNPNKENEGNVLCPIEAGFSRRESLPIMAG